MVPAVYDEFDSKVPSWARPSIAQSYAVAPLYDRRDNTSELFVPNRAYEGGVYLKFIVDYYDNLPDVTVFVQADASGVEDFKHKLRIVAQNVDKIDYQPLNVNRVGIDDSENDINVYIYERG